LERKEISKFEAERIAEALHIRHDAYLQEGESFEVSGYVSEREIYITMLLHNQDDSFYYPVECRVDPKAIGLKAPDALDLVLDFQDYYFGRYFREERDLYLSIDWTEVDFDDKTIQAKGQIINRKLESMADSLLGGNIPSEST
jgi:hypothetical protein